MTKLILSLKSVVFGVKFEVKYRKQERFSGKKVLSTPIIGVGGPIGAI
jgi:hypothetical protein